MKRIFLLEAIDLAVMERGQAITLPIDSGEILLSVDRQALAGEARAAPPALEAGSTEDLSPTEAGRRLGLTPRAILSRIKRGTLQARRRGKRWVISPTAFTAESMPLRQRRRTIRGAPKRKDFFTRSLARPSPNEITAKEAAKRLGTTPSYIAHFLRAGSLPGRLVPRGKRKVWMLPRAVSWGKKGTDFKLGAQGQRITLGSFQCPRCKKIWTTKNALATHIGRRHTKLIRVPGQRR